MMPETMTRIEINHGDLNSATRPLPIPTAVEALPKLP